MPSSNTPIRKTDMTVGSPLKLILTFTIPLLIGNIFQQLYNVVDSIVVGNYVGSVALAAVGTAFPVIFMFTSLFMGIGIGATIMIAQYFGAGDNDKVRKTVDTIYSAIMIGAIPLTVVGVLFSGTFLKIMKVPADTFADAHLYITIIFLGIIASLGYNVNAGILQGLGDSRSPLIFLSIATAINIALDLLFVVVFGWGVAGVAIATVIAQFSSWLFGIFYINKKYPNLHIRPFHFSFDKALFLQAVKLGVPAGIQQAIFSIGIMAMQSLVNSYGSDFMAGYNGASKIDTFSFLPIQSFATSITTFVGQNIGAGKMDRVKQGAKITLIMSIGCNLVISAILLLVGPWLMRLFSPSEPVIQAGLVYMYRVLPFHWLLATMFIINGIMRGAGEMTIPLLSTTLSLWAARVPSAYLIAHYIGRDDIFFCNPIGWALGVTLALSYYLSGRWKNKAIVAKKAPFAQLIE